MLETVIKRDGSKEPFSANKLNKWAEYASQYGGNWSVIAQQTYKRLNDFATTEEIHETMIDVCLSKKSVEYSRVASRLEFATIRKNMHYVFDLDDKCLFEDLYNAMVSHDIWRGLPPFNPEWEDWYDEIFAHRLEFWQVKQWCDKYASRMHDLVVETPHMGFLAIGLALFGDDIKAKEFALGLVKGIINLPTPALSGLRNGDWDTISCCVISGGDTTDSIGVADYIAYRMTAKKAGIGIEFTTRSKGDKVKGGRVRHLGKWPIYKMTDRSVKCLTQVVRGGNATVTALCIDPEIESIINWRSQRTDLEQRMDKMDFELGYNDAFAHAVIKDEPWYLFSVANAPELYEDLFYKLSAEDYFAYVQSLITRGVPHTKVSARKLLTQYLTVRQETGRFYDHNLSRSNTHTPFIDVIRQSNLCEEICLPTHPYDSMQDLFSKRSVGETAFCSLSALNVAKIKDAAEYEHMADLVVRAIDIMIDKAPMMTKSMKESIMRRRSIGVGITGLASLLYKKGMDFDGSPESLELVRDIAEMHYYYLLKASINLADELGSSVKGIDLNWLPIDTATNKSSKLDWEHLRGRPRRHSVLVAHMPTESSSLLSGSSNGVYPIRNKVINKRSRKGLVQYICAEFDEARNKTAWEVDNIVMSRYYSAIQDWSDQAISADFYNNPNKYPSGRVPMSVLMKEWVAHFKLGNKTKYYLNTNDFNGGSIQDVRRNTSAISPTPSNQGSPFPEMIGDEDGCDSCKL